MTNVNSTASNQAAQQPNNRDNVQQARATNRDARPRANTRVDAGNTVMQNDPRRQAMRVNPEDLRAAGIQDTPPIQDRPPAQRFNPNDLRAIGIKVNDNKDNSEDAAARNERVPSMGPPTSPPPKNFELPTSIKGAEVLTFDVFVQCKPANYNQEAAKTQGWKLHISANPDKPEDAQKILNAVAPILNDHGVVFKFAGSDTKLSTLYEAPSQQGKFITIYPDNIEQAFTVGYIIRDELDIALGREALNELPAPPGDMRIAPGMYCRLGKFNHPEEPLILTDRQNNEIRVDDNRERAYPKEAKNPFKVFNGNAGQKPKYPDDIGSNPYDFR